MLIMLQVEIDARAVTTTDLIVIAAVFVFTLVATRFIRPIARAILTWLARRSGAGQGGRWRVRSPRIFGESLELAELRRRQRIAATATGLSRILSAALWALAVIIMLERAEINPVLAISGAGFLGVAIAIGGQHSVNDFVTGLHVLLEDRFGEGDRLRLRIGDQEMTVTVAHLGAFATRLEDGTATFHIPNRELTTVANLSQRGSTTEFEFEPSAQIQAVNPKPDVEAAVRARYTKSTGFDGSRDGLVFDSIKEDGEAFSVRVRTARPLSSAQRDALSRKPDDHDEAPLLD